MAKQTKVAANLAQNYTPSEQAQARQNIGLATVAHTGDFNDLVNRPESINGQVQSNWTQDNVTAVDFIRNKPVIVSPVNADWDASSGLAEILNKPETKYWYFDLNGDDTTTWATIGPTSVGATTHLPIQWDDQGTAGRKQIRTNFTQGDPEAFPLSQGSSWIVLKKGLWRYTLYVDMEPTTLGTGIAQLQLWMRVMTQGVANYPTVRRIEMPTNNNVQSMYTRTISGLVYSDEDPTYSGGEIATYRSIHFDFDLNGACDAVYRFRQNALMLERVGV